MNCSRCSGLMTKDHFMDFQGTAGFMWMAGWRCMNCGHIQDPVIERNRQLPHPKVQILTRDEPAHHDKDVYLEAESVTDRAA